MASEPLILLVSVSDVIRPSVRRLPAQVKWLELDADLDRLFEKIDPAPALVICGMPPEEIPLKELAQVLRMQCQHQEIFLVTEAGNSADKRVLKKNGFNDVFFLPLDEPILLRSMNEALVRANAEVKAYRAVQVTDLTPGTVLDFDTYIYLPANGKYIKFSNNGEEIDAEQIDRLNKHVKKSLHISVSDASRFFEHTANHLKNIQSSETMSSTEKSERIREAVRGVFGELFAGGATATSAGKQIVEDCQKILSQYIGLGSAVNWYEKLLASSSQESDAYSHSGNTSTYAGLFSIALGLGNTQDVALAALLHDVGLAKVPADVLAKSETEWSAVERSLYQAHPEHSVRIIQERKLVLPEKVQTIVLQHHETWCGSGYPKGLRGNRISIEAQLLSFADEFDRLTSIQKGERTLTPIEAIQRIRADDAEQPGQERFDRELLLKLSGLFPTATTAEAAPPNA